MLDIGFVLRGPDGMGWGIPDPPGVVEVSAVEPIRYAEPLALAALAAWAERIRSPDRGRGSSIQIADSVKSRYAWNTGILSALAGKTPFCDGVQPTGDWFPLCRAATAPIIDALGEKVGVLLNVPTTDAKAILAYTIAEMVRNAHEHRQTDCPIFFAAGWFRSQGRLTFAVADAGVGIPAHLRCARRTTDDDDDAAAIERALQPYVTGESAEYAGAPSNAGMGLYMTRGLVASSGGEFVVQSGGARFLEQGQGTGAFETGTYWKGTLVQVSLKLHQMRSFDAVYQSLVAKDQTEQTSLLKFYSGPKEATDLVPPIDRAGFAANKGWFEERRAIVYEELSDHGMINIDFRTAKYTTQSALHALLYDPIRRLGPSALNDIWFDNASSQIRAVARQVVSYALEHHREERSRERR